MQKILQNKKRLGIGVSVLVVMLMGVWFLGIKTPAYAVFINGKQQFIVKDRGQVDLAVKQISQQVSKGKRPLELNSKLEFKRTFVKRNALLAEEKITPELKKGLQFKTNAVAIIVNDKKVACMTDKYAAQKLLNNLKGANSWVGYGEKLISATFVEKVAIKEAKVSVAEVLTPKAAWSLITTGSASPEKYKVQEGDTLWSIARAKDMYVDDILKANNLQEDDILDLGQEIILVKSKPYINVTAQVEGNATEVIPYQTKIITDSKAASSIKVKTAGANGKKEVAYVLKKLNGNIEEKKVISEKIIEQPKDKVMVKGSHVIQVASRSGSSGGSGALSWPISGYISQYFAVGGHTGIDIAGSIGSPIMAAAGGTVVSAGWNGGYGNCIVINHGNGLSTRYAHCSKLMVSAGQSVSRGQTIALRGSTGNSTGPHTHFEVISGGSFVNPLNYLR
jgi:murein DD-endopeptidase MepM/ murein hydrolase activator NlpD